jgi:hypothetical protein
MQISANNLLQAAQQALSVKPAARQPAQPFAPASFAPEAETPPAQSAPNAAPGGFRPPGSKVDIRI